MKRPYPQAVCGQILGYHYDRHSRVFSLEWVEDEGTAHSKVYLPSQDFIVVLEGEYTVEMGESSASLVIPPLGGKRSLNVILR